MAPDADIYIFTKDNSSSLASLIDDLWELTEQGHISCTLTVVDDSVRETNREAVSRLLRPFPRPIAVLREAEQIALSRSLPSASLWSRRRLGAPGYDLATCRNVAFAHRLAANRSEHTPVVFLDADIRLTRWTDTASSYEVDGAAALVEMLGAVATGSCAIAGAPVTGRADFSLLDHLDWQTRDQEAIRRAMPSLIQHSLPAAMCAPDVRGLGQPLGMSGGAMCATAAALREAPMADIYNEDILWLALLKHRGFPLKPIDCPVIHADARPLPLVPSALPAQALGEASWLVFEEHGWAGLLGSGCSQRWGNAQHALSGSILAIASRLAESLDCAPLTQSERESLGVLVSSLRKDAHSIDALPSDSHSCIEEYLEHANAWKNGWKSWRDDRSPSE